MVRNNLGAQNRVKIYAYQVVPAGSFPPSRSAFLGQADAGPRTTLQSKSIYRSALSTDSQSRSNIPGTAVIAPGNELPSPTVMSSVKPQPIEVASATLTSGMLQQSTQETKSATNAPSASESSQSDPKQLIAQAKSDPEGAWLNTGIASRSGPERMPFGGRILRTDKNGKQTIIPVKFGQIVQQQAGDQLQYYMPTGNGAEKQLTPQEQRDEAIKKMSYGDKLSDAAKMVPDLLKGDAKAAFKSLTTDPLFVAELAGVSTVFAVAQATPAGPFIDAALIAVLGFSGGFSLANYLLKANSAKDEAGLKESANELKNLVEIVGLAALSGALRTASKVLGRIKGSVTAEQASRKVLFDEMTKAGIKHTPENILKIARDQDGGIVFLEKGTIEAGKKPSGLAHILDKHAARFIDRGIAKEQIPELVMAAATRGKRIGTQGSSRGIYEVVFEGKTEYISV